MSRKDLAGAFRRVNPATSFDLDRAHKWLQGRAQPRDPAVGVHRQPQVADRADPAQLARQEALVRQEQSTLASLNRDGTEAEAQALKAEQQSGKPGEATAREQQRTDFYDNFYSRIGALKNPAE